MTCGYCAHGWRSLCECTEDCGTDASPIGPCPLSPEGIEAIRLLREETEKLNERRTDGLGSG